MYNFVKNLNFRQALLQKGDEYFVASFADVSCSGPEVLVFPADSSGQITDWLEVDGGKGFYSLEEFLSGALSS
jgi:hypothetical protein